MLYYRTKIFKNAINNIQNPANQPTGKPLGSIAGISIQNDARISISEFRARHSAVFECRCLRYYGYSQ